MLCRVGPDAPEIVQGLAVAMKGKATKKQFDSTVGVHPTGEQCFTGAGVVVQR